MEVIGRVYPIPHTIEVRWLLQLKGNKALETKSKRKVFVVLMEQAFQKCLVVWRPTILPTGLNKHWYHGVTPWQ